MSGCYTLRIETDEVARLGASAPRPGPVFAAANTESRKGSPANEVRRHAPRGCRQRRLIVFEIVFRKLESKLCKL